MKTFDPRLRIIGREKWGARSAKSVVRMKATPRKVWVHHTVAAFHRPPKWNERTFFKAACAYVREVQAYHQNSQGWSDVGYSFILLKPYFRRIWAFEGRGWGVVGAHTEGSNSTSIGIAVAGNFMNERAGFRLVYSIRRLIERGLVQGHLAGPRSSFPTGGHQDAPGAATACPGTNLQKAIPAMRKPTRWYRERRG